MFSNAKAGDRVWNFQYGWGTIAEVTEDKVVFATDSNNGHKNYCWIDKKTGKYNENDINPAIYWQEFEVPKVAFNRPLPVNAKVMVWNNDDANRKRRHFSHFGPDGRIFCFVEGTTLWTSDGFVEDWENWELAEE